MAHLMDIRYSSPGSVVFSDDLDEGLSGSAAGRFPSSYSAGRFPSSYSAGAALEIFCDSLADEEPGHFLDSCSLCKRPLSCNRDIFMYRGDTPFCSEECRQEQINIDEAIERQEKLSSSLKKRISSSSTSASDYSKEQHSAIGAVVVGY